MAENRGSTSDEMRTSLLRLLNASRVVVFVVGVAFVIAALRFAVDSHRTTGLLLGVCGIATAVVGNTVLVYMQWRVTVAGEKSEITRR